ncbi:MAG TPA: TVP38/TMEM64 family protein [Chthoniobacterales bacterium]|jgi:uncharacterized membrane protein YdjX (TVP38/TMEM64 family)
MNSHKVKLALFILIIVSMLVSIKVIGLETINLWVESFTHYVQSLGWWGIILYALALGVACFLAIPAMPMTIGAGIIFKFWLGIGVVLAGLAIGAASGFMASRYLARGIVVEKLKHSPKFKAIDTAIGNEGWKIVTLLRMCPLPFGLANYIYGITSIPFWPYLIATMGGILPGTAFFVYLGHAGKAGLDSVSSKNPVLFIPVGIGLIAGVICMVYVGKIARRAVAKATREGPIPAPELVKVD